MLLQMLDFFFNAAASNQFIDKNGLSLSDAISTAVVAEVGVTPELSTTGGTSDGRFIATICPQVVEFGPVSKSIHQIDERVEVASMAPLAGIYARVLAILVA